VSLFCLVFNFLKDNLNIDCNGQFCVKRNTLQGEEYFDAISHCSINQPPFEEKFDNLNDISKNAIIVKDVGTYYSTKSDLPRISRRTEITPRPNKGLNYELLKEIFKKINGKDLFQIPIPCNFSEPLSGLQRLNEELEYSYLLDKAAECTNSLEQMKYVAAFVISTYGWYFRHLILFLIDFIL
jgi:hypothetical protein